MKNIGTELGPTALSNVHGGGFSIWGDNDSGLTPEQTRAVVNAVVQAGKVAYAVGKSIWNAVSSWF